VVDTKFKCFELNCILKKSKKEMLKVFPNGPSFRNSIKENIIQDTSTKIINP
jgi:hypothetical protein